MPCRIQTNRDRKMLSGTIRTPMNRSRVPILLLACVLFLALIFAGSHMLSPANAAAKPEAPKESIPITVPKDAKLKRPIVLFPHDKHAAEDCGVCHHMLEEIKDVYTCATDGCHDIGNPAGNEKKSIKYFRNAFHIRKEASCNGCHALRKKAKKPHGPTACKACHKK